MLFAVKVYDIENSTDLRNIHRQRHLDYMASFESQIMFAGPILTDDQNMNLAVNVSSIYQTAPPSNNM